MNLIYLSLGSNEGPREETLRSAIRSLNSPQLRVLRASSVYETEPLEYVHQRWFLNLTVEAETELFPRQLLARIARIERDFGRSRLIRNGPRTLDIDIILYGNFIIRTPTLTIPHPRFAERRFVLAPLAELAPNLRDPVSRRAIHELLPATAAQKVHKLDTGRIGPWNAGVMA